MRIDDRVSDADEATVVRGLREFNEARLGPPHEQPVKLVVRADDDSIIGGLLGHTKWGWLYVSKLWVADSARGKGLGRRLLDAAETLARARGCTDVAVDTYEFQARPFYEKLGYRVWGTLEGYPPGYRQYYLAKHL